MILSFRDMEVWQRAMNLVDEIYRQTKSFPKEELFSLTNQMRRSAVSVPSNIAEGFQRKNTKEYIQFCYVAQGSLAELETQLEIAKRQSYIDKGFEELLNEILIIKKQINGLIKSLKEKLL